MEAWREELYHHGIKGQKWGVRRFQREDGSLTTEGQKRYDGGQGKTGSKPSAQSNSNNNGGLEYIHERYASSGAPNGHRSFDWKSLKNGYSGALSDIQKAIGSGNKAISRSTKSSNVSGTWPSADPYNPGDPYNYTHQTTTQIIATLEYKNGKQWFDSLDTYSMMTYYGDTKPGDKTFDDSEHYRDKYVYTYGYFSQIKNKGKAFVNKLFGKVKSLFNN